ncbi:DNA-binding response regulator, NarL/FixJ family, contains REC and HTH domains [Amycolatopsis tolypomycina]|uniref:DNA-binding response regulator, NarL/FixJ family, contains REC and HTH domains n=1 Tax=Amycolatopsis tolypomycina TaxID=208445 RepID=A0A1H4UW90_9PSEU|nr:response regulator transcription factor [Amycolatopsis tolypomycina]SEC72678.1 DNA-binding response regulator, NarL/FixJ family, contains REC and HTH domains [Amycolatopsis tolypomycina]
MIRVLLVLSCPGRIGRQLAGEADIEVRHRTPETWGDVVTALDEFAPSVVVLDRDVLGTGDVTAVTGAARPPAVVLLAGAYHPGDVVLAAKAGVRGYVVDSGGSPWVAVVRAVAAGGGWLAPVAVGELLDEVRTREPHRLREPPRIPLTERELSVVRLVAQGCSNLEVAAELGLSQSTVKTHVSRMLARLDLRSRTQLAAFARDLGIV